MLKGLILGLLDRNRASPAGKLARAKTRMQEGDHESALAAFRWVLDIDDGLADAWNGAGLARDIEAVYRLIWRKWYSGGAAANPSVIL